MTGSIRDHHGSSISVQSAIHIVSRIGTDQAVAKFAVVAIIVGAVKGLHSGGQLAVGISGCVAILIRIRATLSVGLQHGDIV